MLRNRLTVLGIWVPLSMYLATLVIVVVWWRELPDRFAIQWSASTGEVTNTISKPEVFLHVGFSAALALIVPIYFLYSATSKTHQRIALGAVYFCTVVVCGSVLHILNSQRSGNVLAQSPSFGVFAAIFAVALVVGILAGNVALPRSTASEEITGRME